MTPREILDKEQERIVGLLEEHGARHVRLFGSLARGDDDGASDIDLLTELPDGGSVGAELLTVLALSDELSAMLGARVDVVTPRVLREDVREASLAEVVPL